MIIKRERGRINKGEGKCVKWEEREARKVIENERGRIEKKREEGIEASTLRGSG